MISRPYSCTVKALFDAPAEVVFRCLTHGPTVESWSGQKASVSSKIGGRFSMFDGWVKGRIVAYEHGKRLSYTWKPVEWDARSKESVVTFRLTRRGNKTAIVIDHDGIPDARSAKEHRSGWKEFVINPLSEFLKENKAA